MGVTWATLAGYVAVYCETCRAVVAWAHETAAAAAFARHVEAHSLRPAWAAPPAPVSAP